MKTDLVPAGGIALPVPEFRIPYGFTPQGTFVSYTQPRHLLTFGPTGSGKGATVIIPALLRVPHSVLCIDPKGQNAAITARRRRELGQDVFLLNPFDELGLGTAKLNPLAHLRIDQRNVVADVRSLADAMIVPGKDAHWTDSALDLLTALMLYLIATKPGTGTLSEMRELLTQPEEALHATVRQIVQLWDYPFLRQLAGRFGGDTNEIRSVVSTAITQTFFLSDPNIADMLSENQFSVAQLKQKPTTVYVILPARYIVEYSRFFRVMVTMALNELTAKPGGYKTLFLLDEFALLERLNAISKAFGLTRGYNVQCWPFLQDVPQLKDIYADRWETFMANAGVVQMFTPCDITTAEYLMRRGGNWEDVAESYSRNQVSVEQRNNGFNGVSFSYSKIDRPQLPPELSMSLHPSQQILFFAGTHSPRFESRLEYWRNPRLAGMYDPDPFHD